MAQIITNQASVAYRYNNRTASAVSNIATAVINEPLGVEKVSLERGGPIDSSGQYTPYPLDDVIDVTAEVIDKVYLEQCLALLSPEDRELLIRHANGETLTALAKDYGYANASGVRKRIERIKKHITEKFSA